MVNKIEESFDLVVIGAGPGGYVAAIRASQLGLKVCLIEREHLGGICLNWGCIPTKSLLHSADLLRSMKNANAFGLSAKEITVDLDAVIERSRGVVGLLSSGIKSLLKKNGVTVILGDASLISPAQVRITREVAEDRVAAKNIVLATGARPKEFPGLESDGVRVWSYKHALHPPHEPKKLLIVGSGAIGVEFASFYSALGVDTTIAEVEPQILPAVDHEVATMVSDQLNKQGIIVLESTKVLTLNRQKDNVSAEFEVGGESRIEKFDTVIVATGITGNSDGLGLEKLGITTKAGQVVTDEYCRTNISGVYAIGDLAGAPWLAHKASHEGILVAEQIAGLDVEPLKATNIASCVYSHPQVASVGLTEDQAKELGYEVNVGRFPFTGNGKAIAMGEREGMVKTIFHAETGELLGAHIVGSGVSELIHSFVMGRTLESTEEELIHTVFPHPTLSEALHESVLDAYGRVIHM